MTKSPQYPKLPLVGALEGLDALLRYVHREAYRQGYSDGLSAGHPLGSHCDDPEAAWIDSDSREEFQEGLASLESRGLT